MHLKDLTGKTFTHHKKRDLQYHPVRHHRHRLQTQTSGTYSRGIPPRSKKESMSAFASTSLSPLCT